MFKCLICTFFFLLDFDAANLVAKDEDSDAESGVTSVARSFESDSPPEWCCCGGDCWP